VSTAYKGVVGPLRDAVRLLQDSRECDASAPLLELADQLCQRCDEVAALVKPALLPAVTNYFNRRWKPAPPDQTNRPSNIQHRTTPPTTLILRWQAMALCILA
jgi:hypothetical protein